MHLDAAAYLVVTNGNSLRLALPDQLKALPSVLPSTGATLMHLDAAT